VIDDENAGAMVGVVENEKVVGMVVVVVDVLVVVVGELFALVVVVARGNDAIEAAGSAAITKSAPIETALRPATRRSPMHPPQSDHRIVAMLRERRLISTVSPQQKI
jgi:hypothetical protein